MNDRSRFTSPAAETTVRRAVTLLEQGRPELATEALADYVPEARWQNRRVNPVLLRRRTRFFTALAAEYGVRLSALLFLVAWNTRSHHEKGLRGRKAAWHGTADWFARQIGLSRPHLFRLVKEGAWHGLLDWQRTGRGILVWISARKVLAELKRVGQDEYATGYYYLRRARLLGINGSIIYGILKEFHARGQGRTLGAEAVVALLPWLTKEAARKELERLYQVGAIQRSRDGFQFSGGRVGWRYFWAARHR
jgi:hypothetical protein